MTHSLTSVWLEIPSEEGEEHFKLDNVMFKIPYDIQSIFLKLGNGY